jgi:hypothetical protein
VSAEVKHVRELGQRLSLNLKIRIIVVIFGEADIKYKVEKRLRDDWSLQAYVAPVSGRQFYPYLNRR